MPNHLLTALDLSKQELLSLFSQAKKLETEKDSRLASLFSRLILATVFLEPSTRTRLSFETAWLKGGGQVISIPNAEASSLNKGESLEDTGRMISTFADIIAIRTPEKGQVAQFAKHSTVPVINAGDGTGEHPTQHLLDLYTIWKHHGTIDGLTIGLMGDCAHSRVLRGMAKMLSLFNVNIIFIAPKELQIGQDIKDVLNKVAPSAPSHLGSHLSSLASPTPYKEVTSLSKVIAKLDVLVLNRVRHEYFTNKKRALKIGEQFRLAQKDLKGLKQNAILLDPLPRVNTFETNVDEMPQAKYFEAVRNGIPVRMALMKRLLSS